MTEQAPSADREPALAKADPAFTNVLCGIDDSRPSAEAARQAILLATPGGSIEFVAVCWTVGDGPHAMSSLNPQRAQRALEKAGHGAIEAGASAKWKIVNAADSAAALIEAAHGRDLAAVGSHAGSRALGIFFGSTASTLVHRAGAPVLVARRPRADDAFPGTVVFACDGSEGSAEAAWLAGRISRARGAELTIVHVSDGETPQMLDELSRQTVELEEVLGRKPAFREVSGDPHQEIPRLAAELRAGLVVMGSRGLGGVKALGSVSERVAQRAPCSVLVVRPPA